MIIDDAPNPFLERSASEIDQKPHGLLGQAKVGQQLLCMRRMQLIDGLNLHQQPLINEQVYSKRAFEAGAFEFYIDRLLPIYDIAEFNKLPRKHHLID